MEHSIARATFPASSSHANNAMFVSFGSRENLRRWCKQHRLSCRLYCANTYHPSVNNSQLPAFLRVIADTRMLEVDIRHLSFLMSNDFVLIVDRWKSATSPPPNGARGIAELIVLPVACRYRLSPPESRRVRFKVIDKLPSYDYCGWSVQCGTTGNGRIPGHTGGTSSSSSSKGGRHLYLYPSPSPLPPFLVAIREQSL